MRTDDGSIIHKCLHGEPEAFGILVDKYREGIYAFVYTKLRNFHDAQDVTQEVFLKAYRSLRSLKQWESFSFWLYCIASTQCRLWLRTQSRRVDRDFIEDHNSETLKSVSVASRRRNQMLDTLSEALELLPETYREVLMLYYYAGMSNKEISRAMGMSPDAIRMRLTRARNRLRKGITALMDAAAGRQELPAGFTFRIVEAIKHIGVYPVPRTVGLPWGLTIALGVIVTVLGLNSQRWWQNAMSIPGGLPISSEVKAVEPDEISVDLVDNSKIPAISGGWETDRGGKSDLASNQNDLYYLISSNERGTWSRRADMPTARTAISACAVNGKIYAIGGRKGLRPLPEDIMIYALETRKGPSPAPGNIEKFTEMEEYQKEYGYADLAAVEEYNPITDIWARKADMPTARRALSTTAVEGKIYAIGGQCIHVINKEKWIARNLASVEEYDPAADVWTKKSDMPAGGRSSVGVATVNGKIYIIGGWKFGSPSSIVEEYDPVTDTWAMKTDIPTPRAGLSANVVDGKIYAIGGQIKKFAPGDISSVKTVEEYDPTTDTWTKKADMPTTRKGFSTAVLAGKIYAIGDNKNTSSVDVECYNPKTDTWTKCPNLLTPRWGLGVSVVNGRIYAIGGGIPDPVTYDALSTVEIYTPEN